MLSRCLSLSLSASHSMFHNENGEKEMKQIAEAYSTPNALANFHYAPAPHFLSFCIRRRWWCVVVVPGCKRDLPLWICVFALEFTSIDLFAFCTLFILLLDDVVTSWWASAAIRSISFLYSCVRLAVIKQDGDGAHIKFVNWNKKWRRRKRWEGGSEWGWCCHWMEGWMDERLRWNTQLLFIALVGPSTLANLLMILLYVRRPRTVQCTRYINAAVNVVKTLQPATRWVIWCISTSNLIEN